MALFAFLSCFMVGSATQGPALTLEVVTQGTPEVRATVIPMAREVMIKKGTLVTLIGRVADERDLTLDGDATVTVKVGERTVGRGSFHGDWKLNWNTAEETSAKVQVSVSYWRAGQDPKDVFNSRVTLIASEPLTVTMSDGPKSISLTTRVAPGLTLTQGRLYVNGAGFSLPLNGDGTALIPKAALEYPDGKSQIIVTARLKTTEGATTNASASPVAVDSVQRLKLKPSSAVPTNPNDILASDISIELEAAEPPRSGTFSLLSEQGSIPILSQNVTGLTVRLRDLPESDRQTVWAMAKDEAGKTMYSKKVLLSDLGVPALRAKTREALEIETRRLLQWQPQLLALTANLRKLAFGHLFAGQSSWGLYYRDEDELPENGKNSLQIDYEHLVPMWIDPAQAASTYQQALLQAFPEYWKGRSVLGSRNSLEENVNVFFTAISKAKESFRVSHAWIEVKPLLGAYYGNLFGEIESAARAYVASVSQAERLRSQLIDNRGKLLLNWPDAFTAIQKLMQSLEIVEVNRFGLAQLVTRLRMTLGVKPSGYRIEWWSLGPRNMDDILGPKNSFSRGPYTVRDRQTNGTEWWNAPFPLKLDNM